MDYTHPVEALIPGAQGRILGVLARTDAEFTLRALSERAKVSINQTSTVVARLVHLGVVEGREAGTAFLVRLSRAAEVAELIRKITWLDNWVIQLLRDKAQQITPQPAAVVLFGSFARGQADADSDVDLIIVRPKEVAQADDNWRSSLEEYAEAVGPKIGNPVQVLEVGHEELRPRGRFHRSSLWREVTAEGVTIFGHALGELPGSPGSLDSSGTGPVRR